MTFIPGAHTPAEMNRIVQKEVKRALGERYATRFSAYTPQEGDARDKYDFNLVIGCQQKDRCMPFITFEVSVPS